MHESALAKHILDKCIEEGNRSGAMRIISVKGRVAETETLFADSLKFHFDAHARGTIAEGAQLELALVHARAKCKECKHVYLPEHHHLLCPQCASLDAELLDEAGVWIESIEVV